MVLIVMKRLEWYHRWSCFLCLCLCFGEIEGVRDFEGFDPFEI